MRDHAFTGLTGARWREAEMRGYVILGRSAGIDMVAGSKAHRDDALPVTAVLAPATIRLPASVTKPKVDHRAVFRGLVDGQPSHGQLLLRSRISAWASRTSFRNRFSSARAVSNPPMLIVLSDLARSISANRPSSFR